MLITRLPSPEKRSSLFFLKNLNIVLIEETEEGIHISHTIYKRAKGPRDGDPDERFLVPAIRDWVR